MANTASSSVKFNQAQLDYLERMYPEMIGDGKTTEAEMRFRAGQRSVIYMVRKHLVREPSQE